MNTTMIYIPLTTNTCYDYRWKEVSGSDWFSTWGVREKYNACLGEVESTYNYTLWHPVVQVGTIIGGFCIFLALVLTVIIKLYDQH